MEARSLWLSAQNPRQAAVPERLIGVVQELSTVRTVAEVQEVVRHAARELTGADGAAFVLRDGDRCFYADEDAIAPLWKGRRFPMSACISGWSMLNKRPVVIEDVFQDPRIPIEAYRPTFVKSLAMVPIRTREPIGAIGNYWARPHLASEGELHVLQALADSTSIAIANVTLLEELRAARDAAESASRLKDEFLAMVSHELRTPLVPVLGWASLLQDEDLPPEELREAARAIHDGAQHELRLVDALLDLSQIIAGKLELALVVTPLAPIVEAAVRSVRADAQAKDVRLELAADPTAPRVRADPARLRQVLRNLLSNAIQFTPRGGRVDVTLDGTSGHARVSVRDTGEGIPPEFVPHLFQLFRQRDGSLTRAVGGMGLGLATVRHLVALHGGDVHAESPGKGLGATFTVSLPAAA